MRRPSVELARDAGLKPEGRVGGAVLKGRPGVVGMSGWMEELGHSVSLSLSFVGLGLLPRNLIRGIACARTDTNAKHSPQI